MIEILRQRRSIRQFQKRPVENDKIDLLMEAALRSPSSRGLNPWEFIIVTNPTILVILSECKPHGAKFLSAAPLAIVICADPEKCDENPSRSLVKGFIGPVTQTTCLFTWYLLSYE